MPARARVWAPAQRQYIASGCCGLASLCLKTHAQTFTFRSSGQKVDVCAWVFHVEWVRAASLSGIRLCHPSFH